MKSISRPKSGSSLREVFPRKVLLEAKRIGTNVQPREIANRTDCRQHPVITIDPASARDFDDAFSLRRTRRGPWELRIHIADVSHYVKPGSSLDREARLRGNSTYLPDRVIPMLPESLSNNLCSLLPGVERLTKCVEFLLSDDGQILRTRFSSAVIRSRHRFTYEDAMCVIGGKATNGLERMIQQADHLAQKLRARRLRAGSLEFSSPETCLRLDRRGRVIDIEQVQHDQSHQLIEEFMLLANEAVATRLLQLRRPGIHRVHEQPDPDRLREFRAEVRLLRIPCGDLCKPEEVRKLLGRLDKSSIGPALRIGFLRTLPRARYATQSLGHYGLAKENYAHFTSPIRRYADLLVHRSLFQKSGSSPGDLRRVAEHLSATERASSEAERDSKRSKLCDYLRNQLRQGKAKTFTALVTGIVPYGFFVDIEELGMGGLVPRNLLKDDRYDFDSARRQIRGRRSRRLIRVGDRVQVKVAKVDSARQRIDFALAAPPARARRRKAPIPIRHSAGNAS